MSLDDTCELVTGGVEVRFRALDRISEAEALRVALPQLTELTVKAERQASLRARQAHRACSPLIR